MYKEIEVDSKVVEGTYASTNEPLFEALPLSNLPQQIENIIKKQSISSESDSSPLSCTKNVKRNYLDNTSSAGARVRVSKRRKIKAKVKAQSAAEVEADAEVEIAIRANSQIVDIKKDNTLKLDIVPPSRVGCPFYLADPSKHHHITSCHARGFKEIAKMRDHVKDVHRVPGVILKQLNFKTKYYKDAKTIEAKWKLAFQVIFPGWSKDKIPSAIWSTCPPPAPMSPTLSDEVKTEDIEDVKEDLRSWVHVDEVRAIVWALSKGNPTISTHDLLEAFKSTRAFDAVVADSKDLLTVPKLDFTAEDAHAKAVAEQLDLPFLSTLPDSEYDAKFDYGTLPTSAGASESKTTGFVRDSHVGTDDVNPSYCYTEPAMKQEVDSIMGGTSSTLEPVDSAHDVKPVTQGGQAVNDNSITVKHKGQGFVRLSSPMLCDPEPETLFQSQTPPLEASMDWDNVRWDNESASASFGSSDCYAFNYRDYFGDEDLGMDFCASQNEFLRGLPDPMPV